MQVGGVNVSPESANHMIVSLNGVIQKPTDAFTVSGSTITFASNLVTGDVINFIQILGSVLDLGVPSDATVTTAKIVDANVTLAKLSATGTKNSTTFLRGDNTFNAPPLGGITMANQWRTTAAQTNMDDADHVTNNWEQADSYGYGGIGSSMTQSSGIFTFPSTGIYYIQYHADIVDATAQAYLGCGITTTTDNSSYNSVSQSNVSLPLVASGNTYCHPIAQAMFDVTDTTTHKVRFIVTCQNNGINTNGSTVRNETSAVFIRLGDT
jgi:hypothetical protein